MAEVKDGQSRITVARAARRAGLTANAVRFYESHGLLEPAVRTELGHRTYADGVVDVLRFIRRARILGLSLLEIRELVDLQRQGAQPCDAVLEIVEAHLERIDLTIRELKTLRRTLAGVRHAAAAGKTSGDATVVCRIIASSK